MNRFIEFDQYPALIKHIHLVKSASLKFVADEKLSANSDSKEIVWQVVGQLPEQ